METNVLDNETKNKIGFVTFIIEEFATSYKMNRQEAYRYLKRYGGIDYIFECWQALHIDNPFWVVREMFDVCRNNGGHKQ